MTPNDPSADGATRGAGPWTSAPPGMRNQGGPPGLHSQRRIQSIGIAATSVAATIWLAGVVWAWQVIG